MKIISKVNELREAVEAFRQAGKSVGLVPTMGALHEGHKSLVDRARKENDAVVVSCFLNPTQFNNKEDLRTYPRTAERDAAMLESCGVDVAFMPTVEEIYPEPDTRVFDLGPVQQVMADCEQALLVGDARPCLLRREGLPADCCHPRDD